MTVEHFSKHYDARVADQNTPSWLQAVRDANMKRFVTAGFPTSKLEDWRHTDVSGLTQSPWRPADRPHNAVVSLSGSAKAHRAVLVDGYPSLEHCALDGLPKGVEVVNLADAAQKYSELLEQHFVNSSDDVDAFEALNTAFHQGWLVHVAKGVTLDRPLEIMMISNAASDATVRFPRVLVVAEDNAQLQVWERHIAAGVSSDKELSNSVVEFRLGCGAQVSHLKIQDERPCAYHIATQRVRIGRDARFSSHVINLGAKLARTCVRATFTDTGGTCDLGGLSIGDTDQHADAFTVVNHAMPHCNSSQFYKGILAANASSIFNGKVVVAVDAQKTDAQQKNQSLLLSKKASASTRPQLEIYADDVKCAHGATVGQLDENQLFYMRSRGIPQEQAKRALTYGFAKEVIDAAPEGAQEILQTLVQKRLGELSR